MFFGCASRERYRCLRIFFALWQKREKLCLSAIVRPKSLKFCVCDRRKNVVSSVCECRSNGQNHVLPGRQKFCRFSKILCEGLFQTAKIGQSQGDFAKLFSILWFAYNIISDIVLYFSHFYPKFVNFFSMMICSFVFLLATIRFLPFVEQHPPIIFVLANLARRLQRQLCPCVLANSVASNKSYLPLTSSKLKVRTLAASLVRLLIFLLTDFTTHFLCCRHRIYRLKKEENYARKQFRWQQLQ